MGKWFDNTLDMIGNGIQLSVLGVAYVFLYPMSLVANKLLGIPEPQLTARQHLQIALVAIESKNLKLAFEHLQAIEQLKRQGHKSPLMPQLGKQLITAMTKELTPPPAPLPAPIAPTLYLAAARTALLHANRAGAKEHLKAYVVATGNVGNYDATRDLKDLADLTKLFAVNAAMTAQIKREDAFPRAAIEKEMPYFLRTADDQAVTAPPKSARIHTFVPTPLPPSRARELRRAFAARYVHN